jgi:predicted NUDIX family NTP pyrophosphohydrolase
MCHRPAIGVRRQTRSGGGKRSAGILLFRRAGTRVDVLLGRMGGPFWVGATTRGPCLGEYELDEIRLRGTP